MKNCLIIILTIFASIYLLSCQTVTKKIDEKITLEEKELSKWLNQTQSELKIVFGQPDKIEFLDNRNRQYIYIKEKLKIKCERKFEINPGNVIIGFSSKNCF
tara:strand:+ start:1320 stop:1625 length:306 start_codon:yes stop_codon:yes gene_type:complete